MFVFKYLHGYALKTNVSHIIIYCLPIGKRNLKHMRKWGLKSKTNYLMNRFFFLFGLVCFSFSISIFLERVFFSTIQNRGGRKNNIITYLISNKMIFLFVCLYVCFFFAFFFFVCEENFRMQSWIIIISFSPINNNLILIYFQLFCLYLFRYCICALCNWLTTVCAVLQLFLY